MIWRHILNFLIWIDQLANYCIGGEKDETLSAHAARKPDQFGWKQLGQFLEWVDPGHLEKARQHFKQIRRK